MDENTKKCFELKLKQLQRACELAQYGFTVVDTKNEIVPLLDTLIQEKQSCSVGGSMTLFESGVIEYLEKRSDIEYLDRYHSDDPTSIFRQAFSADVYITSTNALTMQGELYNVDGSGNRVAAMIFGPKKVFVICGINKLVENLEEAMQRVKFIAAPANNIRLNKPNPCTEIGRCADCKKPTRICCAATIISHSLVKERIHLILVKEELGY